jgi:hypothetical protein
MWYTVRRNAIWQFLPVCMYVKDYCESNRSIGIVATFVALFHAS